MNKKLQKMYYESRVGYQVIGCILKKPSLLQDMRFDLLPEYFYNDFHRGMFSTIYNLSIEGITEITGIEIEAYLHRTSPKWYKIIFEDTDGFEWLSNAVEQASLGNFEYNYSRLRKLSVLRNLIEDGIDVSDTLDLLEVDPNTIEQQSMDLDKLSWTDITKRYTGKIINIESKYESDSDGDYKKAGDNSDEIKSRLKKGEAYGLMGISGYKNKVTYGCRRKKFHLMGASSGTGKSRGACGEITFLTAVEIWDYNEEKFVRNPNNPHGDLAGIYVGTELDLDMEVDIIMWATVSGLETSKIIEMDLTEEEEERLDYAIDIIKRSKIHLYDRPNYDINTLERIVKKHQLNENVFCLGIDYILLTGNLVIEAREFSKGMYTREDQLFLFVSKSFKERLANKLNIYVSSSTQLNRSKDDKNAEKNEGMIRGSFALCDKVDVGSILMEIENYEIEKVQEILKKGFNTMKPNQVEHIFKVRGGKLKKIRIFKNVNLGNMHSIDLFCTNWDYELIDVEQMFAEPYIEDKNDEVEPEKESDIKW